MSGSRHIDRAGRPKCPDSDTYLPKNAKQISKYYIGLLTYLRLQNGSNNGTQSSPQSSASVASAAFIWKHFVHGSCPHAQIQQAGLPWQSIFRTPAVGAHVQLDDSTEQLQCYTTRPSGFQLEPVRAPCQNVRTLTQTLVWVTKMSGLRHTDEEIWGAENVRTGTYISLKAPVERLYLKLFKNLNRRRPGSAQAIYYRQCGYK
jgi:hypothetical protein